MVKSKAQEQTFDGTGRGVFIKHALARRQEAQNLVFC
jgi:hypothetical protein